MHYCTTCKKELPDEMFYKNKFKKSGLQDHCRDHQSKFAASYYLVNSKMVIEKQKLKNKLKKEKQSVE